MIEIKVNTKPLSKFATVLKQDLEQGGTGPVGQAMTDWATMHWAYLYGRFYSGGGDRPWQKLSEATVKRKGHGVILVDTFSMQEAFNPAGHPSQMVTRTKNGIKLGISGGTHPKSRLSLGKLIENHQYGIGVPARPTFVPPNENIRLKMKERMKQGIRELLRETGAGE